jgi:hypothetical protein
MATQLDGESSRGRKSLLHAGGRTSARPVDVITLAATGGRERTAAQLASLLAAAGFELTRVLPTASQHSIVEATVV